MVIKVNGTEYNVTTSWDEVDVDRILTCDTFRDELKALTTIPHDLIDNTEDLNLFPIYTLVGFIDDLDYIPQMEVVDVAVGTYNDFEMAKRELREGKPYQKFIKVARVYYPEQKNAYLLLCLGANLVDKISTFLSNYEEMSKAEPDAEEVAAGVDELSGFGSWGTAYELAQKDITKVNTIFDMRAIEVYTALHYSWKQAQYMKRLHEIRYPKKA